MFKARRNGNRLVAREDHICRPYAICCKGLVYNTAYGGERLYNILGGVFGYVVKFVRGRRYTGRLDSGGKQGFGSTNVEYLQPLARRHERMQDAFQGLACSRQNCGESIQVCAPLGAGVTDWLDQDDVVSSSRGNDKTYARGTCTTRELLICCAFGEAAKTAVTQPIAKVLETTLRLPSKSAYGMRSAVTNTKSRPVPSTRPYHRVHTLSP